MLNTAIEAELNRRLTDSPITYAQGTLLGLIDRAGNREVAQIDLEAWMGLSRPTVNSIISRLAEKKFLRVTASEVDRRRNNVQITPLGREQAAHMADVAHEMEKQALIGFSPADVELFTQFLLRTTENVRNSTLDERKAQNT